MSGTYGISLSGTNTDHLSTTGVMVLSVPQRGLSVAKSLIFDQGLMYAGVSSGVVNTNSTGGSAKLLTQLSHYVVRTTTDGSSAATQTYVDSTMSGAMQLKFALNQNSGLTGVTGQGIFLQGNVRLNSVKTATTSSSTDVDGNVTVTTTESTTFTGEQSGSGTDLVYDQSTVTDELLTPAGLANTTLPILVVSVDGVKQSSTTGLNSSFVAPSEATNWAVGSGETGGSSAAN